ncbi:MAG: ABC transporter permease [Treponema sp.]|jgi:osmoprotectant transport system permease protein|nr:ABC transporter permease [Treponema sp.]
MSKLFLGIIEYIHTHRELYVEALKTHLFIGVSVLAVSLAIGIPLGVLGAKKPRLSAGLINVFSALKMIPSLALLMVCIPILGTGFFPAFFALILHCTPTILISTFTGFRQVDAAVLESAQAMGMTAPEIFRKVEAPLAMPLIYAGLRTCAIDSIASTTLAAYIGAGGLGMFIVIGLSYMDFVIIMTGSLTIAVITIFADLVFYILQKIIMPYERVQNKV